MRLVLLAVLAVAAARAEVTYSREISRIFQAKCQQCHRQGDIAPFALDGYEAAATWAADIERVVRDRIMPPWKPVAGHGEFRDSYGLTDEERSQILEWAANGAPEGDPADLPEKPEAPEGEWVLGDPDLVLEMPVEYSPPRGRDMYRCFVLPTGIDADKFVSAVDVLPGDRKIVHHIILFLDSSGVAEQLDAQDEEPGYTCFGGPGTPTGGNSVSALLANGVTLGGWAPGTRPRHLPEGIGMHLPATARVVMQVHYYTVGRNGTDKTRVGLYFSKAPVERRLFFVPLVPLDLRGRVQLEIPAGDANYTAEGLMVVPPLLDAHIVQIFPHMHLLGREIRAEVIPPREDPKPLIYIDNWDFNWQGAYNYVEAVAAPAFSMLRFSCTYDNSENNPKNPNNPVKTVRWGEGTEDEMCVIFLGLTFDRENLLPLGMRR
jgi:hypothetical protein